jgi:hypothetical protein
VIQVSSASPFPFLLLIDNFTFHETLSLPVGATLAPPTVVQMFELLVPKVATIIAAAAESKGTIVALGCAASPGHTISVAASELPIVSTITVLALKRWYRYPGAAPTIALPNLYRAIAVPHFGFATPPKGLTC